MRDMREELRPQAIRLLQLSRAFTHLGFQPHIQGFDLLIGRRIIERDRDLMGHRHHQLKIVMGQTMFLYPINRQASQNPALDLQGDRDQRFGLRQEGQLLIQWMQAAPHRPHIPDQHRLSLQEHHAFRAQGVGHGNLTRARKGLHLGRHAAHPRIPDDVANRIVEGNHCAVVLEIAGQGLQDVLHQGLAIQRRAEQ